MWFFKKKSVYDSLSRRERDAVDIFCGIVGTSSNSNEMIATWLGRNPEEGGKVVIGHNTLVRLMWKCIAIAKGIEKMSPEVEKALREYQSSE